jgi:UrcA family protein
MISSRVLAAFIGIYAVAVVLLAPRVTYAEPVEPPPAATVRLGDLNLETRVDVAKLFRRIRAAAAAVCRPYAPHGTLLPSAAYQFCIGNAISGTVRKIDSPFLTAYYLARDARHSVSTASR